MGILLLLPAVVFARTVKVGIGFSLPPYVIRESDSGLESDIVREALRRAGHDVQFVYLPNLRLPVAFDKGDVDCVVANKAYDLSRDSDRAVYQSMTTINYRNYAITLKRSDHSIESISDLAGKQVLAFNNAIKYLGAEFADMARGNKCYSEVADQSLQGRLLLSGRVQVVISDKRIFRWWCDRLDKQDVGATLDLAAPLEYHPIFPLAPRAVNFGEETLRDAFDKALETMRQGGKLEAIMNDYSSRVGFETPCTVPANPAGE